MKLILTEKILIDSGFCFDYEAPRIMEILNSKPEFENTSKFLQAWEKAGKICKVIDRIALQSSHQIIIPVKNVHLIYDENGGWYLEIL